MMVDPPEYQPTPGCRMGKQACSEMGELLYDLKYHGRSENIEKIVDMLNRYKGTEEMDAIVPVPSTNKNRRIQPVLEDP